ncbi:trifunctional serine/threonine-protein kinase/ATP-binding protein/sensor histidine kinase [Roseofilum casamattae]|uniref:histidine kinase n=1 Tax=Roseofilum casamattae BLCC-M143 TaxID=3022442 RepID=A0ABT7BYC4_9CYAN|nr:ATP-binding sensor histidine kinase [Roseofilum casamattae]MDJ1184156.1 AAA family ATPase [Roseofilum casamattae BLCC-M143]
MTNLPGYHLSETLYQGTRTLVYRGTRTTDRQPVVIKFLRNEYPSFNELLQFRNQYTIAKNLDLPGIVKPLSLETHGHGYALVMPDDGYISLGEWKQKEFSLPDFLAIAIQLTEILHGLYQNRVIHKDIKPANILIHPQTKQVKLIDFSISSLLPKETLQISNPNVLEGTLAYISPEQTGRMNRGIDYRTDFYSLGVTFYELLAGELPFQSDDPMELVHCHIAKSPMGLENEGSFPQAISNLVMKLMAKNAEDRYQSALGLKYDLEKCLSQWQETGKIEEFELGERDICDRFIIPEKLYGREGEVQTLLDAFERVANGATETILVAGFSGIGKTAVVNEVHKPIVRQRGYFIKGKYDQFNRNIPFSAFVGAFRDLMGQMLSESEEELANWKAKILKAVGENGQVLIDVIPELERVIGSQPVATELSGTAAQNRFNLLFEKFIAVFTTPEHPLVMFLDDLQWADSASLNLIKVLMGDRDRGYLLLLGAYRDNEVFPGHLLMLTLGELEKESAAISTLTLAPLPTHNINQLIAETLSCSSYLAQPLTELVYQKTKGNPFFTTQFLKGLYEDELILFNADVGYWECDLVQVRDAALIDDVVEFMTTRLQKLPEATQEVLKLAACIGNQFDLETLAIVSESSVEVVATDLWTALREGLIIPITQAYKFFQSGEPGEKPSEDIFVGYRFLHDRVQQAAYTLIPEKKKLLTHFNIGHLLLNKISNLQIEEKIFEIVCHLNLGLEFMTQKSQQYELAKLNLIAGKKAKICTAYSAAFEYLSRGIEMLAEDSWQTEYKLTLDLYVEATEVSYLQGDFKFMEQFGNTVLQSASNLLDKIKIYETQLQAHSVRNQFIEGIHVGLMCLKLLGVDLPDNPDTAEIGAWLDRTQKALTPFSSEAILDFPEMIDPATLSAMRILSRMIPLSYFGRPSLLPLISCQGILLSLEYGNTTGTPVAYVNYALVLCNPGVDNFAAGYQYGQLAKKLMERQQDKGCHIIVLNNFYSYVSFWRERSRNSLSYLIDAYQIGLEVGDLEFSMYALTNRMRLLFGVGRELEQLKPEFERTIEFTRSIQCEVSAKYADCQLQVVLNLMNSSNNPWSLKGDFYDEDVAIKEFQENKNLLGLSIHYFSKIHLNYLFGRIFEAVKSTEEGNKYIYSIGGHPVLPEFALFASLTHLAAEEMTKSREKKKHHDSAKNWSDRLDLWARNAPMNYQHKADLVEAERQRILGNKIEAIELYDRAIAGAKENEYIQEEALANELAAKFYLNWGKEKIAQTYMVEAYYCYARWGAKAKTDHLEATYPQLLAPILQQPQSSLSLNAITTLTSKQTLHTSTYNTTALLDISAAIKASQALSGEIELEALLSQLMQILIENAGADKGTLVLKNAGTWEVVAQCIKETCELSVTPLNNARTLPVSIVRIVQRTQETILLDRVEKDTRFEGDRYLRQQQPKSLFCTPILNQGQLRGILYLENNLSTGAFTPERVEVLNLICSQAAISIENARLYQQAQNHAQRAQDYAQKLEISLEELKQAQLQMVQSEKMSALGNLVAGVAHEINNPVGFIGGNLQPARDYVQDLFGLIDLYQEKLPNPDEELEEEIEAIDLDFLREDLPKLIDSMKLGVDRIAHISTSLRTFSRTDKEHKVPFNLHDGIDSTLLILKHRLKANEERPAIAIIKEYGNIPEVRCFPGQLNQVFMNLIANAIDALDEGNAGRSFEEIAANANRITIATSATSAEVVIRIADNGVGMPEEVKQRIFEQGFTTKGVGKGTGLGMAIARQIVEEKHGGTIACTSQLGKGTEFAIALP